MNIKKHLIILWSVLSLINICDLRAEDNGDLSCNNSLSGISAGDWREGIWNRDVSENLIIINAEAIPVISSVFKPTTPWGLGFTAGFEHKMRPSIIHGKVTFGYGIHSGVTRFFGKRINVSAHGNEVEQTWDKYKSYTDIPVLLDLNMYYNKKRSNLFIGISAGINLMIGERDAAIYNDDASVAEGAGNIAQLANEKNADIVSIQITDNNLSLNHVIPTFRLQVGYMYELTQDLRLRFQAGIDYQMKYFDEYKGLRVNENYISIYHQHDSPAMLSPFVTIGLVYSL